VTLPPMPIIGQKAVLAVKISGAAAGWAAGWAAGLAGWLEDEQPARTRARVVKASADGVGLLRI
jgi:hypothetical protein